MIIRMYHHCPLHERGGFGNAIATTASAVGAVGVRTCG